MANYQVSATELTPGALVLIRGKLGFARLTRLIEGEELVKSDQRRAQNNMNPVGKPHVTATVTQAEVLPKDQENGTLTREELFVAERRYNSKKNPETGLNYSIDSKGNSLPTIAIPDGEGKVIQDTSGRELAPDLDVTLVLQTYKPKNFAQHGLRLEQVIVNEPVRYYAAGGVDTNELAARGVVFAAPPQPVRADSAQGEAAPIEGNDLDNGTVVDENGFAMPGPGQSQPAPTAPQVQAQPQAQASVQAQPAAPAPVQTQTPAPVQQAAPAAKEETMEQKVARLEAENAQYKNAGSAVGAPGAAVPASPWNTGDETSPQAGITLQG